MHIVHCPISPCFPSRNDEFCICIRPYHYCCHAVVHSIIQLFQFMMRPWWKISIRFPFSDEYFNRTKVLKAGGYLYYFETGACIYYSVGRVHVHVLVYDTVNDDDGWVSAISISGQCGYSTFTGLKQFSVCDHHRNQQAEEAEYAQSIYCGTWQMHSPV